VSSKVRAVRRSACKIEGERGDQGLEQRELIAAKAAGAAGRERERLVAAIGKRNRLNDIVGEAVVPEIGQDRELACLRWSGKIAADRPTALIGDPDRAVGHGRRKIGTGAVQALGRSPAELPESAK
jgi:hypothetical protein